jgi:hypothetical protein
MEIVFPVFLLDLLPEVLYMAVNKIEIIVIGNIISPYMLGYRLMGYQFIPVNHEKKQNFVLFFCKFNNISVN